MKFSLLSKINKKIGIDLGSQTTRMWVDGKQEIFEELTCIAIDASNISGRKNRNVIAIGSQAVEMDGRVGDRIEIIYPVKNGVIQDDLAVKVFLKMLLNKYVGPTWMINPVVMVSVPASSTQADREIITSLIYDLGVSEVYTIAQPLAASIGSGVPIADVSGSFFLHLGAGIIEGVVISLGSIISLVSSEKGGEYFLNRIKFYLQDNFDLKISEFTAEKIIKNIITASKKNSQEMMVGGQDIKTCNPKEIKIKSLDLMLETIELMNKLESLLRELLSKMPPELTVDVIDKGLLLSGGLSQIANIEDYFVEKLGIPVTVIDNPQNAVIKGIGVSLEHLSLFKKSLGYNQ